MKEKSKFGGPLGLVFFWLFMLAILGTLVFWGVVSHYSKGLPSVEQLKNYNPKKTTLLYDADGAVLAEFATEKRVVVPIEKIPPLVKNAFIAAEDQNFYRHSGIDLLSILRAIIQNTNAKIHGDSSVSGGSTITQQVIKNLVLSKERSLERKIKEAILAIRITKELPKDKILEIYLNEIFLGNRSYGVGAAAENYFGKTLEELQPEEAALLAAMPKAPSSFDPNRNPKRALERRNWVLDRMASENYITDAQLEKAKKTNIVLHKNPSENVIVTGHFAEEVRRNLLEKFGEEKLYTGGLFVRTTLNPTYQKWLEKAFMKGIVDYDRSRGWRGAVKHISDTDIWREQLSEIEDPKKIGPWQLAVVIDVGAQRANIGFKDGTKNFLNEDSIKWTGKKSLNEVFKAGDVIIVGKVTLTEIDPKTKKEKEKTFYELQQIPQVNGAAVVMDPHTGRVLAMVGGYIYDDSQFNRATQAYRQPGSAFKPFVYLTALENGFKSSTIINDGPLYIPQGPGLPVWAPKNYSNDYLGAVPMRVGLEKSRNNMTVQLARMVGISKIQEMATRFGILDKPLPYYPMVLGAQETTLMRLINAYATLANGGRKVESKLIDRVQDSAGKVLFTTEKRQCPTCGTDKNLSLTVPEIVDNSPLLVDPAVNYQLVDILQGVVTRGTAVRALSLKKPLAGKTGTTNESMDTWFVGFTPDLLMGTYVGYDTPRTLGEKATGSSVALPIFINFMEKALADKPAKPFKAPDGLLMTKVDISTGKPADENSDAKNIRYEVLNPKAPQINYDPNYNKESEGNSESPSSEQIPVKEEDTEGATPSGIY